VATTEAGVAGHAAASTCNWDSLHGWESAPICDAAQLRLVLDACHFRVERVFEAHPTAAKSKKADCTIRATTSRPEAFLIHSHASLVCKASKLVVTNASNTLGPWSRVPKCCVLAAASRQEPHVLKLISKEIILVLVRYRFFLLVVLLLIMLLSRSFFFLIAVLLASFASSRADIALRRDN